MLKNVAVFYFTCNHVSHVFKMFYAKTFIQNVAKHLRYILLQMF